jgi:serine/threonine-protein kinase
MDRYALSRQAVVGAVYLLAPVAGHLIMSGHGNLAELRSHSVNRLGRFAKELHRRKVVRVGGAYLAAAFLALQVVSSTFPALPLPEWADTMVLALLVLGFPVALALAWALELTPEGLRGELSEEEAEDLAVLRGLRDDSIAVLPFDNLSTDPENEYFSDGVTEDIIASVARIRGIRVLARPSVIRYKGARKPVRDIAEELGVATVVTGSVRRSDGRLRIVVQVVDARDDSHRWSETYDRSLGDVFEIQSEVAANVAAAVRKELSHADRNRITARGTVDGEAYDLYLRARFLWNRRDVGSVEESVVFFRKAADRDPSFALAHAGLADAHVVLGIYGVQAPADVYPKARAEAERALALDPTLGEAVASAACVRAIYDWDWEGAEEQFRHAIVSAPSYATAHQWYATMVLTPQRRFAEALSELERAHEIDPDSPVVAASRGIVRFYERDYSRARREIEAVVGAHPHFGLGHYFLAMCHEAEGRVAQAAASAAESVRLSGGSAETLATQGHALGRLGRTAEAEAILTELHGRASGRYVSPVLIALVLLGLGREDEALAELERGLEVKATELIWLGVRPTWSVLERSQRFRAVLARMGLAALE